MFCGVAVMAAACTDDDAPARGAASIAWSITLAGAPASCADVGAASVLLRLRSRGGADVTTSFPCAAGRGVAEGVPARAYDATLTLLAVDASEISRGSPQPNVTIGANEVTALSPVRFGFDERGSLALSFATVDKRSNCADAAHGGSGIDSTTIVVLRASGECAPLTFRRSRGAFQLGTFTASCFRPVVNTCIERDETLTADNVEPGQYVLQAAGARNDAFCWRGFDVVSMPAGGAGATKSVQLVPERSPFCLPVL